MKLVIRSFLKIFFAPIKIIIEIFFFIILLFISLISRFSSRSFDIGLGPDPLINNYYHKIALERKGFKAETFVSKSYPMFDKFDYSADKSLKMVRGRFRWYLLFAIILFKYRALYIYFNGGPLKGKYFLHAAEPFLLKVANVKVVVMPYGGDVQDLTRSPNHLFKHAMSMDYPNYRFSRKAVSAQIDRWTRHADHVISGCDWVDYMYHWDTLVLGHFSIDTDLWKPPIDRAGREEGRPLRLLHAPNHRCIKGTEHFIRAVDELRAEGIAIELNVLERVQNDEIRCAMAQCDVVCDQLVVGWYAMFALEAMAMGKPVICHLRPDLKELYIGAGLISVNETPIIEASVHSVKETLRQLAGMDSAKFAEIGERSRTFVEKHHSLDAIGAVFAGINRSIGIEPSGHELHCNAPQDAPTIPLPTANKLGLDRH